jgi:hypothetical protein
MKRLEELAESINKYWTQIGVNANCRVRTHEGCAEIISDLVNGQPPKDERDE